MPAESLSHFRNLLSPVSQLRYALWRIRKPRKQVTVRLKSGVDLSLRPLPATDYGVAYDIFLRQCYQSPRPLGGVHRIVDLGSNVGYSCLFWCRQYPQAQITACEPHPVHLEAITRNVSLNSLVDRVQVVNAAAGNASGAAFLSDAGSSSAINTSHGYQVPVVDAFDLLRGRIDLLKIDIEGGEYSILGDERFGTLDVRTVVVEWHRRGESTGDREWCEQALQRWGFQTEVGVQDLPLAGLVWGFKK